jgi:hypothetical protein
MGSQVSGKGEVELKSLEKRSPKGAPSLSFYRPREGPGVHERWRGERERRKRKTEKERASGESPSLVLDN